MEHEQKRSEMWRMVLSGEVHQFNRQRRMMHFLPSNPRCKICSLPFGGVGGTVMRVFFHKSKSNKNPNICDYCEKLARTHPGGAEVPLSMLFADVRGSTTIAEQMSPVAFSALLNRFYKAAGDVLIKHDAMIDKFVGDEIIGLFLKGVTGMRHAHQALDAAQEILEVTGYRSSQGPWIPVGIGIHSGVAFVGSVGSTDGFVDFTALGDSVNITARLASLAKAGEILTSEELLNEAGETVADYPMKEVMLKGKSNPIRVHTISSAP